ncbi:sodium-dependent lysophosphatidylcholine symporter 1-like isoform X2 [Coregonus clupeaformis]|uniref:sodium-dependent lysophosphatidylcholine symporter 1-like isoform X2 n=1 Tax=Coregonus clupeaformis TaxID=59861 RepID=UPI001BE0C2C9|nr:sodium-dependent lysophosphatidylcholine symporter 1-like isoform X2 [Coregonus clupeaformis]
MSCFQTLTDQLQTLRSHLPPHTIERQDGNTCKDSHQCKTTRPAGIPLSRKLCYAVGGVPYQITTVAMGFSLQIFLLDVVQIEAFYVSLILFVSRAWDAVTDPLVGYLVSRSSLTPIGKLMPWVVLAMPFGVLSYVLLWFMPQGSMSQAFSVPWYLTASCLFETLMTCFNVPYLSLSMFLGGDQRDRDSATAYRMSVEMLAMLVASVIQGQVVAVYNTERAGACQQLDQIQELPHNTPAPQADTLQATRKAFLTSALVIGGLFFLCCLVLFLGVKEQHAPLYSPARVRLSYLTTLKMLVCHIPYQRLVLGLLFAAVAFQMSLGNFALFCTHVAGLGAQFQHLLLALLIAATIAVPLWQAILLFIPAVTIIACVPSNLPVFVTMCVMLGFSLATMFLLPWSMLPDVVDDFALRNPCCKDLEPLFFSCYAFCSKLGGGLSVGISTMTLHFVGYRAGACSHSEDVVTALIVLFAPVPITLLLVGLVFFHLYPINEDRRLQLQRERGRVVEAIHSTDIEEEIGSHIHQSRHQPHESSLKSSGESQPTKSSCISNKSTLKSHNLRGSKKLNNQSNKSAHHNPLEVRPDLNSHSQESKPNSDHLPWNSRPNSNHCSHKSHHRMSNKSEGKFKITWV